ncbi:hypothetical protein [Epilithonimonas sp. UC225_85]|uniref:hypothetical protein n=1 Tax=Epilithonimonas sp. UC225_85 TaxID=3350167 RepID=UPI0036D34A4E
MKKLFLIIILLSIISCKKSAETNVSRIDSSKIIDSINIARTKINDSILSHDRFKDLEGTHILKHDMIEGEGKVTFLKIGRDQYKISGNNSVGKNFVDIEGTAKMTSAKNLKFEGTITQSILDYDNGKQDVRKGKKNFSTKDGGKTFKLHESINHSGFSDGIIIKF